MQQALQEALSQLFYDALLVIGITIMMFSVSWQRALIALLSLPRTGLVIGISGSRSPRQFTTQWRSTGQLNGQVEESFSGHDLASHRLWPHGGHDEGIRQAQRGALPLRS
ncbi:ABC transporter transmembrane domain-containing protein, partial [Escherichia coli]|uniref:ABC transporter transmembrane domain-containing protein n=1 Tax=Escherichia coli TaxID=562 RepID=UPI003132AF44